jgi:5-methylcytosine-specific restriction enzyme A
MLKSCKYCGGIHDRKYVCPSKPIHNTRSRDTQADRFRNTNAWKKKRGDIKDRDKRLCQVCIRMLHHTINQYTFDDVQVHHIVPINEDYNKRLDNEYLISLCRIHHEAAEAGEIPRELLHEIAVEQEERNKM